MSPDQKTRIEFNGEKLDLADVMSVTQFIAHQQITEKRYIVVINDEIVPKMLWDITLIGTGDRVDIVSPISGG